MNDIEKAILEAFEKTVPNLAKIIRNLYKLHADKRVVTEILGQLEGASPTIYNSALLYVEHIWEEEKVA